MWFKVHYNRARTRRQGFSLTELLVVVSVMTILSSLLLPALARGKAQAHRIKCVNNMRQLTLIWNLYSGDNDEVLVANGAGALSPTWVAGSFESSPGDMTNTFLLSDPRKSLFGSYLKTPSIYKCPSDKAAIMVGGKPEQRVRSYGMNTYVGWQGPQYRGMPSSDYKVFRKTSDMTEVDPSRLLVFQEINPDSICRPFFGVYMEGSRFYHYPATYHTSGSVSGFADGHVEHHRWRDLRTRIARSSAYHNHDDSSPGNKDLLWLRERTTIRVD